jgi:hypothetical protein
MSVSMSILRSQFLYIVVFHQLQLVELSRFQYYLDCDHMFDLFYSIEIYSCEVLYSISMNFQQSFDQSSLFSILFKALLIRSFFYNLYSVIYHVMKSKTLLLLLLCNVSRDSLQDSQSNLISYNNAYMKFLKKFFHLLFQLLFDEKFNLLY